MAADRHINDVLSYINEHSDSELTPDKLCEIFYVSKSYLCRIFKKVTGHTIRHYINCKRLLARELYGRGYTLLETSASAGFSSYSHFYRMYCKESGTNPHIVYCIRWGFCKEFRKFGIFDLFGISKFMGIGANSSTIIQLVYRNLAENTDENQKIPKVQHT